MLRIQPRRLVAVLPVLFLTAFTLAAQDQNIPLKNWVAPLYWQLPAADESLKAAATEPRLAAVYTDPLVFVGMTPCRVVDTRNPAGPFGGPAIAGFTSRSFPIPASACGVPAGAGAYSFNVTVVPTGAVWYLTIWPTGQPQPGVSTLNDNNGQILANAAVVPAGASGSVDIYVTQTTNVLLDINGYYMRPTALALGAGTMATPSVTFSNDANTGLYSPAAGAVNITSAGIDRLNVSSSGVSVNGNVNMSGGLQIGGSTVLQTPGTSYNTAVGLLALSSATASAANNTAVGYNALHLNATGDWNTAVGKDALAANTASANTAVGNLAMVANTTGTYNTAVGGNAMPSNTTGSNNTAVGHWAVYYNDTGSNNTGIGQEALKTNVIGTDNVAVGFQTAYYSTANYNTAVGSTALYSNGSGAENTALGYETLNHNVTGSYNTAVGGSALHAATGGSNVAVGWHALVNNATGNHNIAIGVTAARDVGSANSNNIHIGNTGLAGDNAIIRIGSQGTQTDTYIAGIYGANAGGNVVYVTSSGQLSSLSSSRRYKENIREMGDTTDTIMGLHPVRFRYKTHGPNSPEQYGLVAEEVFEVAPELVGRGQDGRIDSVYYDKVNAMLLNEVQKQHKLIQTLEARLAELENQLK